MLCNLISHREEETWIKGAGALGSGGHNARGQELPLAAGTRAQGMLGSGVRVPSQLPVHAARTAVGSPDGCLCSPG